MDVVVVEGVIVLDRFAEIGLWDKGNRSLAADVRHQNGGSFPRQGDQKNRHYSCRPLHTGGTVDQDVATCLVFTKDFIGYLWTPLGHVVDLLCLQIVMHGDTVSVFHRGVKFQVFRTVENCPYIIGFQPVAIPCGKPITQPDSGYDLVSILHPLHRVW